MKKLLTIVLITMSSLIYGQNKSVTGTLFDEFGEPLTGATVLVEGTIIGVISDLEGNFSIDVPSPVEEKSLKIIFVGYETMIIPIGDKRQFNIKLKPNAEDLGEVVVVGYGTVKKSDLTGAVSSIKAKDIEKIGAIGIEQALSGRAAGVSVTQGSGAPGSGASIVIRGLSSLSNSNPLYVIDGIPLDNTSSPGLGDQDLESSEISPLSLIDPSDIESVEVLKDASSTAIYGSRGANGVILITTKTGKEGKGVITVDQSYSIVEIPNFINLLDANDYTILNNESKLNAGSGSALNEIDPELGPLNRLDSARVGLLESTNWQDAIIRLGTSSKTNISFSGGDKDMNYSISTGILNAEGIVDKTDLDRITSKVNFKAKVTDRVKVSTSLNYAHVTSNQRAINTGENDAKGATSALKRAFNAAPYVKFEEDPDAETLDGFSPVTSLLANDFNNLLTEFRASLKLDYKLSKKLVFKTALTHQNRNTAKRYYQSDILGRFSEGGRAKTSDARTTRSTITNTLNYKANIGKHKITALLGQSLETSETENITVSNFGFPNDLLTYFAPETATFNDPDNVAYTNNQLSSWFGRLNYNSPGSKFLVTLTGRYEASSKFSVNNRWAFFPAAAVGYKLTKEKFMKKVDFINELKFRASFGYSGNQAIQPYQSLNQYAAGTTGFNETQTTFYSPSQLPNPNLNWETTSQLDLGLDFGLFKNRITGTFEYYFKETNDLLFSDNAIAIQSGFPTFTENFGQLQTEGLEMDITARIIQKDNFSWTFSGNIGTGKTVITDMNSDLIQSGWNPGFIPGGTQRLIIGEEVGAFYGYQTTGITQFNDFVEFQGLSQQEQIDLYNSNPSKGDYTFVDGFNRGVTFTDVRRRPGEQLYEDLDENGEFNEEDRQVIGLAQPDISFGINNTFKIGKVDFSFFFDSQLGKEITAIQNTRLLEFADRQALAVQTERWTPENPSNIYPRVSTENRDTPYSSRFVEDGSFVRLQNITLGYSLPNSITSRLNVSSLRIFASGTNIYTWTNYSGYSPDVSLRGSSTSAIGHDRGAYPLGRTIRMGVKLKF